MKLTNPPPQAYTKETVTQAYAWLQSQAPDVREKASNKDLMVAMYLRAKRGGAHTLTNSSVGSQTILDADAPVSARNFRDDLKTLAQEMNQFSSPSQANGIQGRVTNGTSTLGASLNQKITETSLNFQGATNHSESFFANQNHSHLQPQNSEVRRTPVSPLSMQTSLGLQNVTIPQGWDQSTRQVNQNSNYQPHAQGNSHSSFQSGTTKSQADYNQNNYGNTQLNRLSSLTQANTQMQSQNYPPNGQPQDQAAHQRLATESYSQPYQGRDTGNYANHGFSSYSESQSQIPNGAISNEMPGQEAGAQNQNENYPRPGIESPFHSQRSGQISSTNSNLNPNSQSSHHTNLDFAQAMQPMTPVMTSEYVQTAVKTVYEPQKSIATSIKDLIDARTYSSIQDVKVRLNLSSDMEALRFMVALGYEKVGPILPKLD
jgi:hypothetical protein